MKHNDLDMQNWKELNINKVQAIIFTQSDTIETIYMGMIDSEISELYNLILQDGRVDQAKKIATKVPI